jgi:hypothetical protein
MMDKIEEVARAMSASLGFDPDELTPETGYPNARHIARWVKEIEWAKRHIAASKAIDAPGSTGLTSD